MNFQIKTLTEKAGKLGSLFGHLCIKNWKIGNYGFIETTCRWKQYV